MTQTALHTRLAYTSIPTSYNNYYYYYYYYFYYYYYYYYYYFYYYYYYYYYIHTNTDANMKKKREKIKLVKQWPSGLYPVANRGLIRAPGPTTAPPTPLVNIKSITKQMKYIVYDPPEMNTCQYCNVHVESTQQY